MCWVLKADTNWNELDLSYWRSLSTPTALSVLFHLEWSQAYPLHEPTGQQQGGRFGEATGFAICFQNHIDYNKLYTKHCLVLRWVKVQWGGAELIRTPFPPRRGVIHGLQLSLPPLLDFLLLFQWQPPLNSSCSLLYWPLPEEERRSQLEEKEVK